jgi:hypothetical protein
MSAFMVGAYYMQQMEIEELIQPLAFSGAGQEEFARKYAAEIKAFQPKLKSQAWARDFELKRQAYEAREKFLAGWMRATNRDIDRKYNRRVQEWGDKRMEVFGEPIRYIADILVALAAKERADRDLVRALDADLSVRDLEMIAV